MKNRSRVNVLGGAMWSRVSHMNATVSAASSSAKSSTLIIILIQHD